MNASLKGFEVIQEILAPRWIPEILQQISQGKSSYSQILSAIEYLSKTELTRKLKFLLDKGVIKKVDSADGHAHYQLSTFGQELDHIFNHLAELGERYKSLN